MPDPVGLGLHSLKLSPPDPGWVKLYETERSRLSKIAEIMAIEHIGSTAIQGIKAKPIVDIAAAVSVPADDINIRSALEQIGYTSRGEYGLPGRQFFTLGEPPRIHLHVVAEGSSHWRDWLDFRDYLIAHPDQALEYEKEKMRLAEKHKGNRAAYTQSKSTCVAHVLKRARGTRAG